MPTREILGITEFEAYTPEETRAALAAGEIMLIDVRTPQGSMWWNISRAPC